MCPLLHSTTCSQLDGTIAVNNIGLEFREASLFMGWGGGLGVERNRTTREGEAENFYLEGGRTILDFP